MQQTVTKVGCLTLQTADFLLKNKSLFEKETEVNEHITCSYPAIALLGNLIADLSNLRRISLKSGLRPEYQGLCSYSNELPHSEYLFGKDIGKKIKEVDKTNRITRDFRPVSAIALRHSGKNSRTNNLSSKTRVNDQGMLFHIKNFELIAAVEYVIEQAVPAANQVIFPIFLTPKPDGSYRMILNLKEFNDYVTYHHFKMDTLNTITNLMRPNCYMASLDIKDAYSVSVAEEHRKYFRFEFAKKLYTYKALLNGLASCPCMFTKLLKPALMVLHKEGFMATAYIDHLYLQGDDFNDCTKNVIRATAMLTE
eukprot:gene1658-1847_t